MKIIVALLAIFVGLWADGDPVLAQGDPERGRKVFRKCQACHTLESGQSKIGPSLFGVWGRKAGGAEGFNYSDAMRQSDVVWDETSLAAFLESPKSFIPGNRMTFIGLRKQSDRDDVIALLQQAAETATPAAQPAAERPSPPAAPADAAAGYAPDVTFTLRTGVARGKLVFIGQGGDIDGVVNPPLRVRNGDVVQINLINGEGAEHDIFIPEFKARSELVVTARSSSTIAFRATKEGEFVYFCTLPGHRAAGMEGMLVVGPEPLPAGVAARDIVRDPTDLPPPIGDRQAKLVEVELEAVELHGKLADDTTYNFWTFNGKVPGPFLRVTVGDTVKLTLKNDVDSTMIHSVDLHAVTGPGGGAEYLQVPPGEEKTVHFKALVPGLYVYHCATPMVAHHIASGMYGLILVEPEGGLPPVDREFYVMQGEIYTDARYAMRGNQSFSVEKLLREEPEYFVFNGADRALALDHPLRAKVGETVRIYFGVGGPNFTSSFHVIGEIFDRAYAWADLNSKPAQGVQTISVPPGGAAVVEFGLEVPGRYILADHALSRLERGLVGFLYAEGEANPEVYRTGPE